METSNIIALGALIVSFIALIPTYYQVFYQDKKTRQKPTPEIISRIDNEITSKRSISDNAKVDSGANEKPMPTMLRVIVFALVGTIIGLVELIIFSSTAYLCGVEVNLATMSLVWTIIFYSLFIMPGIFFWFAFVTFTTMLSD